MVLIAILLLPALAGLASMWLPPRAARLTCVGGLAVGLVLSVGVWLLQGGSELSLPWIPRFGVHLHLVMDGLSFLLVLLTHVLGLLAVLTSWREIEERVGVFHLVLMLVLTGVIGVFLARDLFLFYLFWELMLVPMALLIALWGHEERTGAAIKFFLFTQAGGLLMLVSILGLVFAHRAATGVVTFEAAALWGTPLAPRLETGLMLGFFVAFAVKLPMVPLHTWLPDAHTKAPTAGSVVLAGLLLKTGAYGLLRFAVPLFPRASEAFAPVAMAMGVVGVLYGAVQAYGQTDLKRLIAYTSVSHLGFVLIGIYAGSRLALQGAVFEMICHGLSTGGLFVLAGILQERLHTRDLARMGGLWREAPRLGLAALVLALASLGLPGLGNFVGEVLILIGTFQTNVTIAGFATFGLVLATLYALRFVQASILGPRAPGAPVGDLRPRELVVVGVMVALLLWLGLFPQAVLDTVATSLPRSLP